MLDDQPDCCRFFARGRVSGREPTLPNRKRCIAGRLTGFEGEPVPPESAPFETRRRANARYTAYRLVLEARAARSTFRDFRAVKSRAAAPENQRLSGKLKTAAA